MKLSRRNFIKRTTLLSGAALISSDLWPQSGSKAKQPNIVFVLVDQHRAQDVGYIGNKDAQTPNLDNLSKESICFTNAISCMPVSTPYRASLLTGQYATTHGLFLNDVPLNTHANSMGKEYKAAGYDTAYIGKWHVNGNGRSQYIPEERRQGFDYFKGLECTHDYNKSYYYYNNDTTKRLWDGYDVFAQTDDAIDYITQHAKGDKPFILMLSWGTPHNPYETAPEKYRAMYEHIDITLRPNVPLKDRGKAIHDIKGYYAHISAIDDSVGRLQKQIKILGIEKDTIFIFTSDHGDMLYSHGMERKQKPFDESILVPFLLKYPAMFGYKGKKTDTLINTVDILPTLLAMSRMEIPKTIEGCNLLPILQEKKKDDVEGTLIACVAPFGEWERQRGGKEYRGVRTKQYTYVRDLNGPWLLFDNIADPYQQNNLVNQESQIDLQSRLDKLLDKLIRQSNDTFQPGDYYIRKWGYKTDPNGTVPYTN